MSASAISDSETTSGSSPQTGAYSTMDPRDGCQWANPMVLCKVCGTYMHCKDEEGPWARRPEVPNLWGATEPASPQPYPSANPSDNIAPHSSPEEHPPCLPGDRPPERP